MDLIILDIKNLENNINLMIKSYCFKYTLIKFDR